MQFAGARSVQFLLLLLQISSPLHLFVVLLCPFSPSLTKFWASKLPGTNNHAIYSVTVLKASFTQTLSSHLCTGFSNVEGMKNMHAQRQMSDCDGLNKWRFETSHIFTKCLLHVALKLHHTFLCLVFFCLFDCFF